MVDRSIPSIGHAAPWRHSARFSPAGLTKAFAQWRQHRKLSLLDARMRKDIGLRESDVLREIDRSVWNSPAHWLR